jgi:hypothetical protein
MARKPFHEAIVDAIREMTPANMPLLARLIKNTKIPHGHDQIIEAWEEQEAHLKAQGFSLRGNSESFFADIRDLFADIRDQKRETEVEAAKRWKAEHAEIIADALADRS